MSVLLLQDLKKTLGAQEILEEAVPLDVPRCVDFGHGKSWLEAH